jgi:hypothetical protein
VKEEMMLSAINHEKYMQSSETNLLPAAFSLKRKRNSTRLTLLQSLRTRRERIFPLLAG